MHRSKALQDVLNVEVYTKSGRDDGIPNIWMLFKNGKIKSNKTIRKDGAERKLNKLLRWRCVPRQRHLLECILIFKTGKFKNTWESFFDEMFVPFIGSDKCSVKNCRLSLSQWYYKIY